MEKLNEITYREIQNLTPIELTFLLKKLLHLEALKYNISISAVYVSLNINVPDGGEDGRIKWDGGIGSTDWIPKRFTVFQCKATEMSAADCEKEILKKGEDNLKSRIEEVLNQNGAYVLFTNKTRNTVQKEPRIEAIRNGITKAGKPYARTVEIRIYDADDIANWVNQFPATITYVCECNGRSLPLGLKTWVQLETFKAFKNKFFATEKINTILSEIRSKMLQEKSAIRILGLSGLGKTRLILEAFRPPEAENEYAQKGLSDEMVYFDASYGADILPGLFPDFVNRNLKGVLVIDNCNLSLHKKLLEEATRSNSHLSLITIDYDISQPDTITPIIPIEPELYATVIKEMLQDAYKELSEPDVGRISEFAQGFPQMAVLLAEDRRLEKDTIGYLNDNDLLGKLLWGRGATDKDSEKVIRACSIFEYFGYKENVMSQGDFIAEKICEIELDEFHEIFTAFLDRGIIETRGRFARVKPLPLAIRLAADWWKACRQERILKLLPKISEVGLAEPLCDQMAKLHFLRAAQEIVKDLCGEQAPFGKAEVLTGR